MSLVSVTSTEMLKNGLSHSRVMMNAWPLVRWIDWRDLGLAAVPKLMKFVPLLVNTESLVTLGLVFA